MRDADTRLEGPLRAVIWSSFLLRAGQSAAAVIIGLYLAYLGRSGHAVPAVVAGVLLSSSYAVELLFAPFLGALSDRFGRKPFIIAGPLIGLLAIQVYPFAVALPLLFLARALEGMASATLTPSTLGYLADHTPGTAQRRGRTMALYEVATLIGIASGYSMGGFMWKFLEVNAFRAAAILYLLSAALVTLSLSDDHTRSFSTQTHLAGYLNVIRQPAVLRFVPAWLCVTAVLGVWFNNVVLQLSGGHHAGQALSGGMSGARVSEVLAGFTLALIVGTYGWSRLFGRFQRKTSIMLIALVGMFAVCGVLLALNHAGSLHATRIFGLLPLLVLAVCAESGFTPAALAYLADITEAFAAERGAIMGLYSIFLSVGEVAGGVVGGWFAQRWGLDGMIVLTFMLAIVAMVTVLRLRSQPLYGNEGARPSGMEQNRLSPIS